MSKSGKSDATRSVTISFRVEAIAKAKLICIAERDGIKLPNLYREIIHYYLRGDGGEINKDRLEENLKKVLKTEGINEDTN